MLELVMTEMLWFPTAIVAGGIAAILLFARQSARGVDRRLRIARAMSLWYGCVIGIMASGHLLVVTLRAIDGSLSQGVRWFLYPLGLVLAIPACFLVATVRDASPRRMVLCNAWLMLTLIPMGPSATLAVPAVLNLVYLLGRRRAVEYTAAALTALLYTAFVVGVAIRGTADF
jgi:hypothetical protein